MNQLTLKNSFTVESKSLHSGKSVKATLMPAEENTGIRFRRIDLEGAPEIPALAEFVVETSRSTVIGRNGVRVSTIEHCLSALYASGVDNCIIEIDSDEMPILDGSALPYVENINLVGLEEQKAEKDFYIIKNKLQYKDETSGSVITIYPDEEFSVEVMVEYNSPVLPNQFAVLDNLADFATEVAGARTFVFVREIEKLLDYGLIKGGDMKNAVVIYDQKIPAKKLDEICDKVGIGHMQLDELGFINPEPLKWGNEPARHKLMDLIGDLALVGRPLKGRVVAIRI